MRKLTYFQAINEAITLCMQKDPRVFIIGEGVPDPKGIFGTTLGLKEKFGEEKVLDMPISENGLTGVCIGAALSGVRPILTHQRIDFSLLSFDQIANVAAKWYYMFGGKQSLPLVIRMIIGRGWGQGSQHSQSLQALYAHIPGLKVVMPATAYDAKGLLISSILDNNPVIFIEHRWLYNIKGEVPEKFYTVEIGKGKLVEKGSDVTIVSTSFMTAESARAVKILKGIGVSVELIDMRTIKPLDTDNIIKSVKKTGRLLVADTGVRSFGITAEVIATAAEYAVNFLKAPPRRITLPDSPTPTSWKAAEEYYPTFLDIIRGVLKLVGASDTKISKILVKYRPSKNIPSDVPDNSFTGPF